MNIRSRGVFKLIIGISIIVELIIAYLINKLSEDEFNIWAPHNIWLIIIFVALVFVLIICKIVEHNQSERTRSKKFQKVFRDNGGFEAIVDEMKLSLRQRDYKTFNKLKRIAEDLEK